MQGSAFGDVDLRDVTYQWDPTGRVLTFAVHVSGLRDDLDPPPAGGVGEAFDAGFTIGGSSYYVRASRRFGQEAKFMLRQSGSGTAGTSDATIATITGQFDAGSDVVSVTIPAGPPLELGTGTTLTGLTASSYEDDGAFLVRADDAATSCSYTLT